jgi:UDP-galactopyranose mutase
VGHGSERARQVGHRARADPTNTDDRYFTDTFQNMPAAGYTRMFENILDMRTSTSRWA